jgi:FAD/FMN-containing dehydrogenase
MRPTTSRRHPAGLTALRRAFSGQLHLPGGNGFDTARAAWIPHIDARPLVAAEACGADDVRAALIWAREHDVPLAVQATGHGVVVPAGGALLLKTSLMRSVLIDPVRRIARVGAGARWGNVVDAAAPFGLVPLSGTARSVAVAGYTTGGGVSWLSRRFGFAADSLLRATVVTAEGRSVTASRDRHADLFWALRGGGGNFGLLTSLDLALYPVASVYAGTATFPIERAADTLARYQDWAAAAPDELSTAIVARAAVFELRVLHTGAGTATRRALRPLLRAAGTPLSEDFRQASFAQTRMPGGPPRSFDLLRTLPDPLIRTIIDAAGRAGSPVNAAEIRHWGGAMARPVDGAGPVGHRDVPFSIIADGPPDTAAALRPYATGGSFLNFPRDPARVRTAYTDPDYQRLREVKQAYDPHNVFHHNHNIPPATKRRPPR